ncbi:hypothetical protein CLAIMM_04041 [Cladophialophora immunda]|nr:hypothetical protein CLAIMM_04041 [Cladophialophora immunda]
MSTSTVGDQEAGGHDGEEEPQTRDPESQQEQQQQQQQQPPPKSPARSSSSRIARPVTQEKAAGGDTGTRYSLAQRVQTLSLLAIGWTPRQVAFYIKVPASEARRIFRKATERGYRPQEDLRILDHYVEDGRRTGQLRNGEARAV